jgi:hypothetical protein
MGAMMPTPLLVEQRFPLDLDESDATIRSLYEDAKADRWDPFRDFDWSAIRASVTDPKARQALRLGYSRRAWHEYTGLSETPAVLIRFCLEAGREADPKYFLTVRNTEEAWHIECFHAVAKAAGGSHPEPGGAAFGEVFNARRHQLALDAASSLDAYVVTYCGLEDEIELRLAQASLSRSVTDPLRAMWQRIVTDRERHARFGWLYTARRAPLWDASTRDAILASLSDYVERRLFAGYQLASLAPAGVADEFVDAEAVLDAAQLGGVPAVVEREILHSSLAEARDRLRTLGLTVPVYVHPVHGSF